MKAAQQGRFIGLRARLAVVFSLLFSLFFCGAFFWFFRYATDAAMHEIESDILARLELGAAGIDGDELIALVQEASAGPDGYTDDPRYWEHVEWLYAVSGGEAYGWAYTYTPLDTPGRIAFIGSSGALETPPDGPTFREPYDAWEAMLAGFVQPTVETKVYTDEWGDWLSGYAPIYDAQGRVVAALGIDVDAEYVSDVQATIARRVALVFALTYLPVLATVLLISRWITRPITVVTQAARAIGRGEYEQDLSAIHRVRFRHEIAELAEAIEESGRVHISEQQLRTQVAALKIEIDNVKREKQVEEIVQGEFFQDLQAKAREMRAQRKTESDET